MSEAVHHLQQGSYGPPLAGGRSPAQRVTRRVLIMLTALLGVVALGVGAAAGYLVWQADASITSADVPGLGETGEGPVAQAAGGAVDQPSEDDTPSEAEGVVNVLVVGSDSREGLTEEDLLRLGTTEDPGGGLTDTIMLVQLNADAKKVGVLGFPRDLVVTRCDGSRGRINGAFEIGASESAPASRGGGPGCLVETVKTLTGVQIDHYVEMNLLGFIDVVDAVGGVTFYVDEPLNDVRAGLDVGAGCQVFDGHRALGFVRARHLDADADFGRVARQERFLRELVDTASSAETLSNPLRLNSLVSSAASAVTVDDGLTIPRMVSLVYTFRDLRNAEIATFTVPGGFAMMGEAQVVAMNEEQAAPIFAAFQAGTTGGLAEGPTGAPPESSPDTPPEPSPDTPPTLDEVEVEVLNGAGQEGLATKGKTALEERGVTVGSVGDADRFSYVTTQIEYPASLKPEAKLLTEVLPDARLEVNDERDKVTVILAADFDPDELPDPEPPASDSADDSADAPADSSGDPTDDESRAPATTEVPQLGDAPEPDPDAETPSELGPIPEQTGEFAGGQRSEVDCG